MKKKYMDCLSGGVLMLFALFGWLETASWRDSAASSGISVNAYPRAVFTCIFICGMIILARTLIRMLRTGKAPAEDLEQMIDMHPLKVLFTVVLVVLYILALRSFGFLFPTPVFLFLAMLLFGERNWLRMVVVSAVGTLALYLFFVQLMNVRF